VLVALGAWKATRLGVPGEELAGVHGGAEFVVAANGGKAPPIGRRVAVVGGGNTAIDAARVALRLGAEEVTIVYRRALADMPASPEEIRAAREEGVRLRLLSAPVSVRGENGRATGLAVQRMELGEPDASGRRRPIPVPGTEEILPVDTVIAAVGQVPDLAGAGGLAARRGGTLEADATTLVTPERGVFAAGDAVSGPDTVVGAIAAGRRAAESVLRFLRGQDLAAGREAERRPVPETPDARHMHPGKRPAMPEIPVPERLGNFREIELGLDEAAATAEAARCLSCAACCECMECVAACEPKAVNHALADRIEEVEVGAVVLATGYDLYRKEAVSEVDADPDVIDGLQFERILCPSGPTDGRVLRPSDGREPQEVVFVACVGSRDPEHHKAYCSRVCCLYSVKMAMLYKHAVHRGKAHVFYMDVRTDGKFYEEFYQRAQQEDGVDFLRGRVSRIFRDGDRLVVRGADTLSDKAVEIRADLVVLATAMVPREQGMEAARVCGVEADADGFLVERHAKVMPLDSSRPGIFVAGTCQGPKDIPECVAHASGTAGRVLALLRSGARKPAEAETKAALSAK
jgi:heterodisulfide reductase subunit A